MATFFCPQGGHCRDVQLQSLSLVERVKSWSLQLCNLTFPWFSCFLFQATIAAFAASEGHAHPRVVELPKVSIWVVSWCFDGAMTKIMVYCNGTGLQIISRLASVKLSGQTYCCSDISHFWPDKHRLRLIAIKARVIKYKPQGIYWPPA